MADAERGERVEDGRDDGLRGTDRPRLADALAAELVGVGRPAEQGDIEVRQVHRVRQAVIHEGAAEQLATGRVMDHALAQRLADALCQAAMHLADRQQGVQHGAVIVDRGVAEQVDMAGVGIDLEFGDVHAVGEGDAVELVPHIGVEPLARLACGGHVQQPDLARLRPIHAVGEHDLIGCGLQQPRRHGPAARDGLFGGFGQSRAGLV